MPDERGRPDRERQTAHDLGAVADGRRLAEAVRGACVEAALRAYEEAAMSGLCHEGAWEAAVGAIRTLDLEPILNPRSAHTNPKS